MSDTSTPAADLIHGLIAGLRDGSLSPSEGAQVLEACAELIEALGDKHAKSWWARLILASAAAAVRQSAEEIGEIPHPENDD